MDISEYEEIQKNVKLLEESLKREKKLSKKIERLQEEKIQVLKNNEKMVTIVTRTEHSDVLLERKDPYDIIRALEAGYLNTRRHSREDISQIEYVSQSFWDKTVVKSKPIESVTTKGLDEVYLDVKKELQDNLTEDIKNDRLQLEDIRKKFKNNKIKLSEVSLDLLAAQSDLENLVDEVSNLESLLEIRDLEMESNSEILELLKKPHNVFTANNILNKIKSKLV